MEHLKTILIVDDEEDARQIVLDQLSGISAHFIQASNGHEALQLLKEYPVDLVICDISMPKMSGREFIKLARHSGHESPFIVFTGSPISYLIHEFNQYGVDEYIDKLDIHQMVEIVRQTLEREITHPFKLKIMKTHKNSDQENDYLSEDN